MGHDEVGLGRTKPVVESFLPNGSRDASRHTTPIP